MLSNIIKPIFIFVLLCIWVAIAGELFMRVMKPQPMLPRYVTAGDFGIRVNMPNKDYVHTTPDYKVYLHTNSKGIRAPKDIPYTKKEGVTRIVLLGDSFGMGYGVNLEDSFSEVMRRKLETSWGSPVEIINLSVSGFGTAEQLLMFQNEGAKYQPDIVISTWHTTDDKENLRSGLFDYVDDELVVKNDTFLPGVKQREMLMKIPGFNWVMDNSQLYNFLRGRAASFVKKIMLWRRSTAEVATHSSSQSAAPTYSLLTFSLAKVLKSEAEKVGAKFVILDIPERRTRTEFSSELPEIYRQHFNTVSPIQELRDNSGQLLYWENSHGHWTPKGCEIVGLKLAEKLTQL